MKKLTVNEKAAFALSISMTALFICAAILAISLMGMLKKTEKDYSVYRTDAEIKLSDLEKKKNELNGKLSTLNNSLELAEKAKAELEIKIGQIEREMANLKESIGDSDELYKTLNAQLTSLKSELESKNDEISILKEAISDLSGSYGADINKQYEAVKELYELLNDPPKILVSDAIYDGNGKLIKDAVYKSPKISLYYEDVTRGYIFKHNPSEKFPTSDCLRLPFAFSVLKAASDEMKEYEIFKAQHIASGGSYDNIPSYDFKYDMSRIFTYTEDKYLPGAGTIKDREFGTEFTHSELFESYIKYGDPIAEAELIRVYGTNLRKEFLANIGASVMNNDPGETNAAEFAIIMKELQKFIASDAEYASLLRDSMLSSAHSIMLAPGIVGKDILHCSGWDKGAYHDVAIVCDESPYVLIFMSDLSDGGDEINEYINKIASLIDTIHGSFYGR